ncbi:MAG: response regulator [Chitinivibrionales bacterium]|nr:response regulator [Chitinivibrionales bacterium]
MKKPHVLLVEDDEHLVDLYASMIKLMEWVPVVCRKGGEALKIFESAEFPVAVILLDLILPDIHGIECICRFKKTDPRVPVVVCTGSEHMNEIALLKAEGAFDILSKPFVANDLIAMLKRAVGEI